MDKKRGNEALTDLLVVEERGLTRGNFSFDMLLQTKSLDMRI